MKKSRFFESARFMVRILPAVSVEECFALKGGTAINLFVRDLPRLSVDIDLTYLPLESRDVSLANISEALNRIANRIKLANGDAAVEKKFLKNTSFIFKLLIRNGKVETKIEPNLILRGSVVPAVTRSLSKKSEKFFEAAVEIKTLSNADLYAGKFCAALDRQHPRDIFDMMLFLEDPSAIDANFRKAFVVYLASHNRPMHELLAPTLLDVRDQYESDFDEMASTPITYEELESVRKKYFHLAKTMLDPQEKQFLLSLKSGEPQWDLLGILNVEKFPALQWKLANIKKMDVEKRNRLRAKLEKVLAG